MANAFHALEKRPKEDLFGQRILLGLTRVSHVTRKGNEIQRAAEFLDLPGNIIPERFQNRLDLREVLLPHVEIREVQPSEDIICHGPPWPDC
jgi:hypothetical protein